MHVSMGLPVHDWSACAKAARQAEDDGVDVITSNELKHDPSPRSRSPRWRRSG